MSGVPGRLNGFTRPFSPAQVAAWTALVLTLVEFLMIIAPLLPIAASVVLTLVYVGLVGAVVYYGGQAQAIDPMDPYLQLYLKENKPLPTNTVYQYFNHPFATEEQQTTPPEGDVMKQCWLCDTQVRQKSMHCKFCNKCVDEFDHHCMWLNTCIGKRNYSYFYRTMLALFIMLSMHFIISMALVIDSYAGNGSTRFRIQNWGSDSLSDPTRAIHAILIFFLLFDAVSLFLVGQLIWFHIGLQREGLSTYEYIVRDHEKKREQARIESELKIMRIRHINKAKTEGRQLYATRLAIGGFCRNKLGCVACDPMKVPERNNVEAASSAAQGFSFALGAGPVQDEDDQGDGDVVEQLEAGTASSANGVTFVKVHDEEPRPLPQNTPGDLPSEDHDNGRRGGGEGVELTALDIKSPSFDSTDEPDPPRIRAVASPSATNGEAPSDEE